VASTILTHATGNLASNLLLSSKQFLSSSEIQSIPGNPSAQNLIANGIAKLGETLIPQRCAILQAAPGQHIGCYIHPGGIGGITRPLGRFGALVVFKKVGTAINEKEFNVIEIGRRLCQHIVGMNPKTLSEKLIYDNDDVAETRFLEQEFLLDSTFLVKEYLYINGVEVIDFVRFQCGES
jgi:elongation factor Ts